MIVLDSGESCEVIELSSDWEIKNGENLRWDCEIFYRNNLNHNKFKKMSA